MHYLSREIHIYRMQHTRLTTEQLDQELIDINEAKRDPKKFNVLYDKYYHVIFVFIHRRTFDEQLTADLSSQVFLKAMLNLKKYEYRGLPFSAWLYRIASNEVSEFYRKHKKQRVVSLETQHLANLGEEVDESEVELKHGMLMELLEQLSPHEMQMIELRYFEKRPFKEVATILNVTENNAKIKVHRLIGKMKKLMKDKINRRS